MADGTADGTETDGAVVAEGAVVGVAVDGAAAGDAGDNAVVGDAVDGGASGWLAYALEAASISDRN